LFSKIVNIWDGCVWNSAKSLIDSQVSFVIQSIRLKTRAFSRFYGNFCSGFMCISRWNKERKEKQLNKLNNGKKFYIAKGKTNIFLSFTFSVFRSIAFFPFWFSWPTLSSSFPFFYICKVLWQHLLLFLSQLICRLRYRNLCLTWKCCVESKEQKNSFNVMKHTWKKLVHCGG
jgi:hypothetical protein